MSPNSLRTASLALHRFGLGPRPGSIAVIASDPRGAIVGELERADAGRILGPNLPSSDEAARAVFARKKERRQDRRARRKQDAAAETNSMAGMAPPKLTPSAAARPKSELDGGALRRLDVDEAQARAATALNADIGMVERLVWFWSNHFCVSAKKSTFVRVVAGAFEREAIRPHVLGRFADMLLAVERHPAMLSYLDNARSLGPNSRVGMNRQRGLNENLAREILELHTLGVRTVYTQADVTSFAKVITGWTVVPPLRDNERGGQFTFNANWHEPGSQTVVGKVYADDGFEQGRAVLIDLARNPATARHIASKLVTHFVADQPPPQLVDRLTKRFLETDGDLREVTKVLLQSDAAWTAERTKLKRPSEWIIGTMRAVGLQSPDIKLVLQSQEALGEPLWRPPAPKGFSDQTSEWIDGLAERLDIATHFGRAFSTSAKPMAVLDQALGALASEATRTTVARAEDRTQALTLLYMSPEFLMR